MDFMDTGLTLALPDGGCGGGGSCSSAAADNAFGGFKSGSSSSMKRGFMETSTCFGTRGEIIVDGILEAKKYSSSSCSSTAITATTIAPAMKSPGAQARVVGWPPVRLTRQKTVVESKSKFVKVGADGAPYLRELDLEMYKSYEKLLRAIGKMFTSFTVRRMEEKRNEVMKPAVNGRDEYVVTYEDKDGDWMLVGDVPWKMFIESCKRVRLMKSSEAVGIGPRTGTLPKIEDSSGPCLVHTDGALFPLFLLLRTIREKSDCTLFTF